MAYYLDQIHVEIAILPRRLHGFHVFLAPHRVEVIGNLLMLFFIMHTSILSCIDKVDINIMRCEKYCERSSLILIYLLHRYIWLMLPSG